VTTPAPIDRALQARSREAVRAALAPARDQLNVMWAQRLAAHCATLAPADAALRIGIVHSYTSELLDPWLRLAAQLQGLQAEIHHAPYGLNLHDAEPGSALVLHQPDLTLFLLELEALHPALSMPLVALAPAARRQIADEVLDRLCGILRRFRDQALGHLVLTLLPARLGPALGHADAQCEGSQALWWGALKGRIAECLRTSMHAASLLDLDEVMLELGRRRFFDHRLWYAARFPFSATAAFEVASRVLDLGVLLKRPQAKVIALDADNTLWGGIIGEDGMEGIALGPDYPGNCYRDFQRRLLDLQQRGFVLALCSKNNPADVDQVLEAHPHQLIKAQHLAAKRVNWEPKANNLRALADELNVGLDAFIFVDDSVHEIEAVRRSLPEVESIQVPRNPLEVPSTLEQVARLQVLSLTDEDRAKTDLYRAERQRRSHRAQFTQTAEDRDAYLASLEMHMQVVYNGAAQVARLAQLTQKTNQFNLTTRRRDAAEMAACIAADDWLVAHFSLRDVFGDSGIVGLALVRLCDDGIAELDTYLMSCRVIGRDAEHAFLAALLRRLAHNGVRSILADYRPTKKNALVEDFLPKSGFVRRADGRFEQHLDQAPASPTPPIQVSESD
jgi:FkbH-like protein